MNDSLCFKEVIMGNLCGKTSTFECKVLYILLKKGPLYWRSNHSHCPQTVIWNIVESMFDFHHTGQFEEHHVAGLGKLWPCALPSTTKNNSAWWRHVEPAYEPMGCTGNIAWHLVFFFFFFSSENVSAVQDIIALGNTLATVSSTATQWLMELMRTTHRAAMASQISSSA